MELPEHLHALRQSGDLLADTASRTGLDALIATCPGWQMRDLVRHMGDVHRWARAHVAERRMEPIRKAADVAGPLPGDDGLLEWFRQGLDGLVRTLESADPDLECWTFLPAPSPVAFWARRQAHETAIHRADAESATGSISPFPAPFAIDGIDELLFGFLGRTKGDGARDGQSRTLHLHATDTPAEWLVRIDPPRFVASREHARADCAVRATASDLYLLVWNRRPFDRLEVSGDTSALEYWRDTVQITWSRGR